MEFSWFFSNPDVTNMGICFITVERVAIKSSVSNIYIKLLMYKSPSKIINPLRATFECVYVSFLTFYQCDAVWFHFKIYLYHFFPYILQMNRFCF